MYAWCLERIKPEDRERWDLDLIAPLPGQERAETPEVIEAEMAQFQTFMSQTS